MTLRQSHHDGDDAGKKKRDESVGNVVSVSHTRLFRFSPSSSFHIGGGFLCLLPFFRRGGSQREGILFFDVAPPPEGGEEMGNGGRSRRTR